MEYVRECEEGGAGRLWWISFVLGRRLSLDNEVGLLLLLLLGWTAEQGGLREDEGREVEEKEKGADASKVDGEILHECAGTADDGSTESRLRSSEVSNVGAAERDIAA